MYITNRIRYSFGLLLLLFVLTGPLQAQVLPLEQKNTLNGNWQVYDAGSSDLVPYATNLHGGYSAVHQWVTMAPAKPFVIEFTAQKDLCLFLNNQLIFTADSTSNYTFDLATWNKRVKPVNGRYLLSVWHPSQHPNVGSFRNRVQTERADSETMQGSFSVRLREYVNQNAFIIFTLLIGLLYGGLKTTFPSDFQAVFGVQSFWRTRSLDEGILAKPLSTWSGMLFIIAFSMSMALLIAAIHTNVQHVRIFNRLFPVSEADITTKVLFYTFLIFAVVLLKYFFLKVMGYIFGLEQIVQVQFSEFLRSLLFLGLFLPVVMLLYLSLNHVAPDAVLTVSSMAVLLLLVITVIRVFVTVNKQTSVINLHLFSYLCATEVIPLTIMLKFIVFNF
ncbi:DUF4271 domain-containing protein [Pontibacter amylolyticus]|uniref:DUF4271 domain-containing protein n=1 Tax=Pontibacter amylolyticus TaxID=1424080 RepID=A0ABQ1W541_9BACT|nr:DUF4271 domain-containing protein [Pontibacter amylolyticus]GGG11851.1 hypothetical protein GCM10011323_15400 [Pontibacter amylolyticus]